MLHDGYRGVDIQLKYNFESDQFTLSCDTYTNGSTELFLMINSTRPTLALPNDRFSISFDGIPTFVRSSCLKKNQQSGRGSLISYRTQKSSGISHEWKIGILHSIWYNQRNKSNHIELWEFLDVVDQDGIPSLLKCVLSVRWFAAKYSGVSIFYVPRSWHHLPNLKLLGASVPGRVILALHLCAYIYCGWPGILWEVP
jgi:hypothetical protein